MAIKDTKEVYEGLKKFKEFIKSGKIRFKQHPSHNIHAKVYISRFKGELMRLIMEELLPVLVIFLRAAFSIIMNLMLN